MSEKSSENAEMSELAWAQGVLQKRIAPLGSEKFVETRIRNAARKLGWKFSRARTVWYQDERASIKPHELRRIEELTGLKYGQQELRSVEDLIANADALLAGNDPDFHRPFVAAFRAFVGALDRARTQRGE